MGKTRTLGSGGSECDYVDCFSFFDRSLVLNSSGLSPIGLEGRSSWEPAIETKPIETINLEEWSAYFRNAIPENRLSFLIYSMPQEDVVNVAASIRGREVDLRGEVFLLNEALVQYGRKDRVLRALDYLALAKSVEPIATRKGGDQWSVRAAPPIDPAGVQELIDTVERRVSGADRFLSQRYRFQALRLMFYSGQYERAQQYYERHKGVFSDENSPKYRFTDLAAGAYYRQKKYGKANYLYSRVFDKFAPLSRSAFFSFHPMEDKDWKETLALARNPAEREVLWQLIGIYADGTAAIDEIYKMNPKSKWLPPLLVREVNRAERGWTGNQNRFSYDGANQGNGPRPDDVVVGVVRVAKIRAIADAGKVPDLELWRLAAGHLLALAGDSDTALKYIDLAEKSMPANSDMRHQARMSRLFVRVRSLQSIDKAEEPHLAKEQEWLKNFSGAQAKNLNTWTLKKLSEVYAKGGDSLRSLMLRDSPQDATYQSASGVERILSFIGAPLNEFDRLLANNYAYSVDDLQELRALNYLYAGNLTNAVDTLKVAAGAASTPLSGDPFISRIRDCVYCDAGVPGVLYTKLSFAERMLALSRTAQGQGEEAAAASFEMANGFYNMSYFGNSRDIYSTRHFNFRTRQSDDSLGGPAINMDLAEKYYLQAATLSSNRELKAKATFMAAKTEQNRGNRPPEKYFGMLRNSYADTLYYQEIIRECVRFKSYLGL